MTTGFALDYITQIMSARGIKKYLTYFRHLRIERRSEMIIDAGNHYYLLIDPEETIIVESKMGKYDQESETINELIYEHTGNIKITNPNRFPQFIRFIQVVPHRKTSKK